MQLESRSESKLGKFFVYLFIKSLVRGAWSAILGFDRLIDEMQMCMPFRMFVVLLLFLPLFEPLIEYFEMGFRALEPFHIHLCLRAFS